MRAEVDLDYADTVSLAISTAVLINFPRPRFAVLPVAIGVELVSFGGTVSSSAVSASLTDLPVECADSRPERRAAAHARVPAPRLFTQPEDVESLGFAGQAPGHPQDRAAARGEASSCDSRSNRLPTPSDLCAPTAPVTNSTRGNFDRSQYYGSAERCGARHVSRHLQAWPRLGRTGSGTGASG